MAAEKLSVDMVQEILSWLPVRSVLRFRCACKLWNSVTREEYFIYSHLERSKSKPPQIIVHADENYEYRWTIVSDYALIGYTYSDPSAYNGLAFLEEEDRHPKLFLRSPSIDYCYGNSRPCNGLICLYNSVKIRLCNPSMREVQILPDATPGRMHICSIGFVALTKEYKVVRLVDLGDHHYEIQVFTVGGSGGSWRRVGDFSSCILLGGEGVHLDGTVHWMVRLDRNSERCTFCLDLTTEKLEMIKLPDSVQGGDGGELICLAPWKEKLVLVELKTLSELTNRLAINVYTLRSHDEKENVWDRITWENNEPPWGHNPSCSCPEDLLGFFSGLSHVGWEGISAWRPVHMHFHFDSRWSHIYDPRYYHLPPEDVYGLYAFQESLVPLEKSAMLYPVELSGECCPRVRARR